MAHSHQVVDDDKSFIIDSATRTISNPATNKLILIQHDHNSERFTFELDKVIEGHDMTQCNCVQVHYINYSEKSREKNAGVYEITDVETDEINKDKIIFTWLISDYATRYAGSLQFLIKFACLDADDITTYSWHTDIYKGVTISTGIENSEIITSPLPDIIAAWKEDIYNTNYAYEAAKDHGFTGTEEEWLLSLHGADGLSTYELAVKNGYVGTEAEWLNSLEGRLNLSVYAKTADVNAALEAKANVKHTHEITDINGLSNTLSQKANSTHSHPISSVSGLQAELDTKQKSRKTFTNISVDTNAWIADSTYDDFPYRASVSCTGVTNEMFADVVLDPSAAIEGRYASVCATYNGGVYLYASSVPAVTLIIPTIIVWE